MIDKNNKNNKNKLTDSYLSLGEAYRAAANLDAIERQREMNKKSKQGSSVEAWGFFLCISWLVVGFLCVKFDIDPPVSTILVFIGAVIIAFLFRIFTK